MWVMSVEVGVKGWSVTVERQYMVKGCGWHMVQHG